MPLRIHEEILQSKNVTKCKNCKTLKMVRYFQDTLCDKCHKEYNIILNKVLHL